MRISYLFNYLALGIGTLMFLFSGISRADTVPKNIAQLFPSATRIDAPLEDLAITPVYQLNELLGYTFESDDFTQFIGFSGQTINLLIGLDTKGIITGIKVLTHNEPIFLHGLGEEAMFTFIAQYPGHSIKERFIINSREQHAEDTTYFDGVTRATISVLVINDTIIASALKVARQKLDGFLATQPHQIKQDFYQPLTFNQLLEKKYIHQWVVSTKEAMNISSKLSQTVKSLADGHDDFIDIYAAFVNIPIIGRNLLGDEEYIRLLEELSPGEHALMLFTKGQYSFISKEFIPQTTSSRLSAEQGGFPVDVRDIDFYSFYPPTFALALPKFKDQRVFRIKSQSGFDISQPINLNLSVTYQSSFLNQQEHTFSYTSAPSADLFEVTPDDLSKTSQLPLWQQIWLDRAAQIGLTVLYLLLVLWVFVTQRSLATSQTNVHRLRFACLTFVLLYVGFYAQGQLSVVNIYTLLLALGTDFNITVFLLDPVIFILWVFVFVTVFLWGRGVFCGWLCPFGALQEFMAMLATKLRIRQLKISPKHHKLAQKLKYWILLGLVGSSFYSLTMAEKLAEIEPFKTSITLNFIRYWPFVLYALLLLVLSLKIHKVYCRYLCPLGAGLAVLGRYPLFKWLTRRKECGSPCQLCRNKKCGIDAIEPTGNINYTECIQCLECLVTIESPQLCVVDKYNKKSLKIREVK
ncbi:Putative electron transport protein YccM [Paraglaciecola mesophila]|uniref:Electron transport protein YccM n=1 Tax=Paraglaciecola mesophila TaxID=197222 RepID=A0A857JFB0_9ALTE|nr:4Fe-4S binding protein [Paraglaciecola mesophila]QHJ09932.1 Putative electron transport protein YccM [Paraglaciecola mesophila]